jgi:type I thyroxine 5'-deiodinase
VLYEDPKTEDARADVASACVRNLKIEIPALIDTADNATERAYTGWPDRLYVIDAEGRVAFKTKPGPFGFKTAPLEAALKEALAGRPSPTPSRASIR